MQVRNFILSFLFFPSFLFGQASSYPYSSYPYSSYPGFSCDVGDTLNITAKSGLKLRDSSSFDSKVVGFIPFSKSVIVSGGYIGRGVFENRIGRWLKVKYNEKDGYIFSGFVTKLKIPEFGPEDLNCWNLEWFEKLMRANIDTLVCQGIKTDYGFDPDGKDWRKSSWEIFTDETVIYHVWGYESEDLVIESTELNMNDILNLLEVYIDRIKQKCQTRFRDEEEDLKIEIVLDSEGFIKSIKCQPMNFIAEKSIYKTIIRLNLWNT